MTTIQIRQKVIDKISKIEDIELLKALKKIVDTLDISSNVYEMTNDEINAVNEGREQIKQGKFIDNSDLEKEEDEWLKE